MVNTKLTEVTQLTKIKSPVQIQLARIFTYHNLDISNATLKELWQEELKEFDAEQIKKAWERWKSDSNNIRKRPEPRELKIIIKANYNKNENSVSISNELPAPGISFLADQLRKRLNQMRSLNPNLNQDIKSATTCADKVTICAAALNDQNIAKQPAIQSFIKNAGRQS